jgi:Fe-S-cluster-containing dehydrogenase component
MRFTRRSLLQAAGAAAGAAGAAALSGPAEAAERAQLPSGAIGLLYDSTRCIGCRACVTKCKEVNGHQADRVQMNGAPYDAPQDLSTTTRTVIKLWTGGDRSAFMKRQCMHCVDPACVSACMIKAFQKDKVTGVVAYDQSRCLGDRYCQMACPFNVPKFEYSKAFPVMVKCELCRHRKEGCGCSEVCPRAAVISGTVAELKAEARRRMAASPERYDKRIYGETEAGGTQCLYITAAGVPFETLGLPALDGTPIPELATSINNTLYPVQGLVAPAVLYAAIGFVVSRNRKKAGEQGEEP